MTAAPRYVYVIEGHDGMPCYIGVGQRNRLNHHVRDARAGRGRGPKHEYIVDCLASGFVPPAYKVAEDLSADNAYAYERTLIAWYGRRDLGTGCLLNVSDGGHGPRNPSPSLRLRRSIEGHARMTPEARAKVSKHFKGRKASAEQLAKLSAAARSRSPEHLAKIGAAMRRRIVSHETREKIAAARRGTKVSPELRARLSEQRQGSLYPNARLTEEIVRAIRAEYLPGNGKANKALRLKYGISRFHLSLIITRKIWGHLDP